MMVAALKVGVDPIEYVNRLRNERARREIKRRMQEYTISGELVAEFDRIIEKHYIVLFAAHWSSECTTEVAAITKLSLVTGSGLVIKIIDFDSNIDLAEELGVQKVPTAIVYDKRGKELGRFMGKTRLAPTVEEELLQIIRHGQQETPGHAIGKNEKVEARSPPSRLLSPPFR
jgi:hypothetical protein